MGGEAPTVLVPDDLAAEAVAHLEAGGCRILTVPAHSSAALLAQAAGRGRIAALVVRTDEIDARVIAASPALLIVSKHGVGVDNIDVAAATERGVVVTITPGANARSVAEHALALMLALAKRLADMSARTHAGLWEKASYRGIELGGKCLGIVGCGRVGRIVAELARPLGMSTLVHDPYVPADALPAGVDKVNDLDALLRRADVVTLHCPLTRETRHLIDARRLALMKPTAYLINTARGGIVDEEALAAALREGRLAGAGLDAYSTEPPGPGFALWGLPNVIATPHVAGNTAEASRRVAMQAAEHVLAALAGRPVPPEAVVNPEALSRRRPGLHGTPPAG